MIHPETLNLLIRNKDYKSRYDDKSNGAVSFVGLIGEYYTGELPGCFNKSVLLRTIKSIELKYSSNDFVSNVKQNIPSIYDRILLYITCYNFIAGKRSDIETFLRNLHSYNEHRLDQLTSINNGSNELLVRKFLMIDKENSGCAIPTPECKKILLSGRDNSLKSRSNHENEYSHKLILNKDMKEKNLFFNKEDNENIEKLFKIFSNNNIEKVKEALESHNFSKGMVSVFYGVPGTGKTELAMQLAKTTGRSILMVNIAEVNSMWHGESEKHIEEIFKEYEMLCKNETILPILLFNEADALFNKRLSNPNISHNTENRMQNILLNEIEQFEGICIATTNLEVNFDKAFERRFLFKIKFNAPDINTRKKLWRDKIEGFTDNEYQELASGYMLSGGEIDNVVKKYIIDKVISENEMGFDDLKSICENEKFRSSHISSGFINHTIGNHQKQPA